MRYILIDDLFHQEISHVVNKSRFARISSSCTYSQRSSAKLCTDNNIFKGTRPDRCNHVPTHAHRQRQAYIHIDSQQTDRVNAC